MELRAFAEQILFATSLEEKLRTVEPVTDEEPGSPIAVPNVPARPAELMFKPKGSSRGEFPARHQLQNASERGKLLHFFANHELLAVELMALVLLRFPNAPAAFRRGVFQTLKDEQEHTRLYLRRMKDCGIHFGEMPVSGFFWRALSGMENPLDYVAGLSLTFEQANLDFARYFAQQLAAVGDADSAALLDRIYRDEIGHVAYGLKWFRRWKNPEQSDWDAFRRQLKFPLSPERAKGMLLNVEGRRAAGLDQSFVQELSVYSQSKGRTPTVFIFNPFAEAFIAQGKAFTPTKSQALLAHDLENLPQFLCRKDDMVLLHNRPRTEFLCEIQNAGFPLPEFIEFNDQLPENLKHRKLAGLRPWAWAPDSFELFAPLLPNVSTKIEQSILPLYSKGWSACFLRRVLESASSEERGWLCPDDEVGRETTDLGTALEVIRELRAKGYQKLVAKQDFGLAGHNALRLWELELLPTQHRWLERSFEQGRTLVIEPWLDRQFDFSVQLEMGTDGLKLLGFTTLLVGLRGQYQGNRAAPNFRRSLPQDALALLREHRAIAASVQALYGRLTATLCKELRAVAYSGPVGIDAFVYRDAIGRSCLKPIVEINPRYTMGRLLIELMRQTCPGSYGSLRLWNRKEIIRDGFNSFAAFAKSLRESKPVCLEGQPLTRIREGALFLNDPETAQGCLALFEVGLQT